MVFSSAIFIFGFLPLTYIVYILVKGIKRRNCFLAIASLVFYAFGLPEYVPLFLCSILVNYLAGLCLIRTTDGKWRKAVLAAAVLLNIGVLAYYKYADFTIENINAVFSLFLRPPGLVLPIGISFFTFQGLSYVIDVYRDPKSGTASFVKLLLYISFFPQLIAGPIVKYHDIADQIDRRTESPEETARGIQRFIRGLGKKLLLANAVGRVADGVFAEAATAAALDWRLAWIGGVCYALQIYYDFSGYSDMAIGMGRIFGFRIKENFRLPYAAASMTDFWQRWHISLTTWFREYLYIPLGGNRKGKGRMLLNRVLVFLCTGLWHGANWTFIVWGLCHGALTSLERIGLIPAERLGKTIPGRVLGRLYTLLSVMLLFVVFRADSLSQAWHVILAMFSFTVTGSGEYMIAKLLDFSTIAAIAIALLLAGGIYPRLKEKLAGDVAENESITALSCLGSLALFALSVLSLSAGGFNPFIYFQF